MQKFVLKILIIFCIALNLGYASHFIENTGQWNCQAKFFGNFENFNIWVTDSSIIIDVFELEKSNKFIPFDLLTTKKTVIKKGHIFEVVFEQANFRDIIPLDILPSKYNYFIGNSPANWVSAAACKELLVQGLYEKIDLKLYFTENGFRYDFIIAEGGDPSQIKQSFKYIDSIFARDDKSLVINAQDFEIYVSELFAYQDYGDYIYQVKSSFILTEDNKVHFWVEDYDKSRQLIIDPLIYSTFLGGANYDIAESMKLGADGSIYICGYTSSTNFPTTTGAYNETNHSGTVDYPSVFLSKFDAEYNLLFSTFIGGFWDDYAKDIAIDADGNIVITGYTASPTSFPITPNAFDSTHNGGFDVFVTKLNSQGNGLIFSTFIGGTKDDYAMSCHLDNNANVFIIGYTSDTGNFPVTSSAFQSEHNGEYDIFITKLNSNGTGLVYSTLLGGDSNDFGQGIVVDNEGIAYITGFTRSVDFPITGNALFPIYADTSDSENRSDAFVSKISADGTQLLYSSYIGGKAKDGGYAITLDNKKDIYVSGYTESRDFPVTENAFDSEYNSTNPILGLGDVFVFKMSNAGDSLHYSTFIGGNSTDRAWAIALDANDNAYITGTTSSGDFPFTPNAIDSTYNDESIGSDAFVSVLDSEGAQLLYSSYLGGSKPDVGKAIAVGRDSLIFVLGITNSEDFPISANAFQNEISTNPFRDDVFLTVIKPQPINLGFRVNAGRDTVVCFGDSIIIGNYASGGVGDVSYQWFPENGISNTNIARPTVSPDSSIYYIVIAIDEVGNMAIDSIFVKVAEIPEAKIFGPKLAILNSTQKYYAQEKDSYSYIWNVDGAEIVSGQGTNQITVLWNEELEASINLIVISEHSCRGYSSDFYVLVGENFSIDLHILQGSLPLCSGDTLVLDAGDGYLQYFWSDGTNERFAFITESGTYWAWVTDQSGFIGYSDTLVVTMLESPPKPGLRYFEGFLQCLVIAPSYQWYLNDTIIPGATTKSILPHDNGDYQVEIAAVNGCKAISEKFHLIVISVDEDYNNIDFSIYPNPFYNELNIELKKMASGQVVIEIFDLLGNRIFSQSNDTEHSNEMKINTERFTTGIYLIRISNGMQGKELFLIRR